MALRLVLSGIATALAHAVEAPAPAPARLVAFVRSGASAPATDFEKDTLPRLREIAKRRGIPLDVRDVSGGAPDEVHLTPLIVYQDAQGRSIFRGRYSDTDRLAEFVRTASVVPLSNDRTFKESIATWRIGRALVVAPLKITALTGAIPGSHDEARFLERARRAFASGLTRCKVEPRVAVGPSDRAFYMDVHPYRDASGKLFLSTAIYSGFDCVTPVFQAFDSPVTGTWNERDDAFARAGRLLEGTVASLIASRSSGDGFDPVPSATRTVSWEALGLALPAVSSGARPVERRAIELPKRWTIEPAGPDDAPRLVYRFAPPLDSYAGEVPEISGEIALGDGGSLAGATGSIVARTASITMGNKTLDGELRKAILRTEAFPSARMVVDHVSAEDTPLIAGSPAPFTATGHLEMLGLVAPLTVQATAEPIVADDGTPRLAIRGNFRLRVDEPFGLTGPDGPEPARETLLFDARFRLKPY